jgi:hypothetical protein
MARYLVVAHQTAESEELLGELVRISGGDPAAEFVLLVPATPIDHFLAWEEGETDAVARSNAARAQRRWLGKGINVTDARVGDASPVLAVEDELRRDPGYDQVIISTLPPGVSRWLNLDSIARVRSRTALPVTHIPAGRVPAASH